MQHNLDNLEVIFLQKLQELDRELESLPKLEALMHFCYVAGLRDGVTDAIEHLGGNADSWLESEAGELFHSIKLYVMPLDDRETSDLVCKVTDYWTPACSE